MGAHLTAGDTDVLIVVDVQNDFCPGGHLPVPSGNDVVPVINRLAGRFANIVVTQDWHPHDHFSFASMHPGKHPNDMIDAPHGPQILWPDHCVQGTFGAQFHESLNVPQAMMILRKGFHRTIDSYSAFYENDRQTPTGLIGYLRERSLTRVFLAGLAFDFCVRYSAEDAQRAGFSVVVIEDACRSIDVGGSAEAARSAFQHLGIPTTAGDFA
jgi:nicotinamidase/pyrazinamidase